MIVNGSTKVLVIAAHPDDEVLGCGGTIARFAHQGHDVYTFILGEGVTSRDDKRDVNARQAELEKLKQDMNTANKILGVKDAFMHDFPDNRFDSVDFLDIVKAVEKVKNEIRPSVIFTHHFGDLNIDHRITHQAVLTAARSVKDEPVKTIYGFEVLSSTEWNGYDRSTAFVPSVFYDVSVYLEKKIEAMKSYSSELVEFPHPRSIKSIKLNAQMWGSKTGLDCAEAFILIRSIL